ncbi:MAG TPA: DUF1583 domain-containing protein [Pirellulaceae bacterium]|nr:DUF1583 domain-containing protein [Pirellulaceae bacterium]
MRATFVAACAISFLSAVVGSSGVCLRVAIAQAPADEREPANEPVDETEVDEELARQRAIVDRFLLVLQRNPRRGTALDKIYGYHVDAGTLEEFTEDLRAAAEKDDDGAGWMILGLVESQRGRDASAVEALRKAVELRPEDALAPYYLGQSLVLVGQPDEAVAAFENSIARKPAATDLLEIFQALGRVHQRAQRVDDALAVWKRLEELFPGDARVQERIAAALAEEGQYAAALPRYEALAASTTDDYRRTSFQLEAADLKVKLDRAQEGIADLEAVLAKLNPDNWLFREVRKKIEDVFLRTEDREGLAAYYERWLEKHPQDVDAMARLSRTLTSQGRIPEARDRLEKALKLAPSRSDLRMAFIAQLIETRNIAAALEQYAAMDEVDPGNPDRLREWGKLHLRDEARPKEEREQAAAAVWHRIVAARPDDPLAAAQTADLFRRAEMKEEALALYEQAVELAPDAPQYREYLGEYLHVLDRTEHARKVWREMAAGDRRTAENLALLAEILVRFGYLEEALPEIAAACELEPKDFALHLQAADFRTQAERYDEAFASLDAAEGLAQNDEERESILSRRIAALQAADLLESRTVALEQKVATEGSAEEWFLLARYREALRRLPEATAAIEKALELAPADVRSLGAAARIAESSGALQKAADLNRRLATVDRRGRTTYLERIASLESQLGRTEQALAAGRELIAAAPGNVDAYQFFADLCARLNRHDEGIAALRRATRVNPNEPNLSLSLAAALAERFRTDEAIEIYWQAFDKAGSLDDKLLVIGKQTELYLQSNRLDQLLERLERGRAEPEGRREATICLAQAYHSAGDYGMARQELESLLNENSRDTQLLQQLSKLAEAESDLTSAIQFQERLAELAPGAETEYRLATLLSQSGETERAAELLVRLSLAEEDRAKLIRNVDRLLNSGDDATALTIVQAKRREDPDAWELLYREGAALAALDRNDEARERFAALLELSLPDDQKSVTAPSGSSSGVPTGAIVRSTSRRSATPSMYDRLMQEASEAASIARMLQIDPRYAGYQYNGWFWMPSTFGAARIAAIGHLYLAASEEGKEKEFLAERQARAEEEGGSVADAVDWYRLRSMLGDEAATREASKKLARRGVLAGHFHYLARLGNGRPGVQSNGTAPENLEPLPAEDLELAVESYEALDAADGDATPSHQISVQLISELDRADRQDQAEKIYRREVEAANTAEQLSGAMTFATARKDYEALKSLFERFVKADLSERGVKGSVPSAPPSALAQALGSGDVEPDQALDLLEEYLDWRSASLAVDREGRSRRSSSYQAGQQYGYTYYVKGAYQHAQETLLLPGDRFDTPAISVVRTVYENLREDDLAGDLIERLERTANDPSAEARDVRLYALAYAKRWSDDQEGYVDAVRRSVELHPQDFQLRLASAKLHQALGEFDEALAVVDALAPADQSSLQQRETLALDLAVRLGDRDRAREAARRLFGLRLPSETQIALASQMRRLGMNEEADAALARAGAQAGGRLSALAALMTQHQSQGNRAVAVEIAYRILQRSRTTTTASPNMPRNQDQAYRQMALQCLASTGQLDESIARLKEQIERSPQATQLYETLAEYCQAKGDSKQEFEVLEKLIELKPKDAALRVSFATRLSGKGEHDRACDLYLAALEADQNLLDNDVYRWVQTFRAANRVDDLVAAIEKMDLSRMRQPYILYNLISNLSQSSDQAPLAAALLKKAWIAQPAMREQFLSALRSDEMWKDPEIAKLAVEGLIPADDGRAVGPWYGFENGSRSYSPDGRITTTANKILDKFASDGTTDELRERVAKAIESRPEWKAGPYLLLVIDVRAGKTADLEARIDELGMSSPDRSQGKTMAAWFLAQEIESEPSRRELALKIYESLADQPAVSSQFRYSPRYRTFQLYKELGQPEKATALLHEALDDKSGSGRNDPYEKAQLVQEFISVGSALTEVGEPLEAVRIYRRLLSDPQFNDPDIARYIGGGPDYFRRQATSGLEGALAAAMKLPDSEESVDAILDATLAGAKGGFDLMPIEQDDPKYSLPILTSPILDLLTTAGAESREKLVARLNELSAERPDDLGVAVAGAVITLKGDDAAASRQAVEKVVALAERLPLETIPADKRPNSRQRRKAEVQTSLWFVAREAYKLPQLREMSNVLTDRAVEAAARLLEPRRLVAILFERGMRAHDAGEVQVAEAAWNELIDRYLVQSRVSKEGKEGKEGERRAPATVTQFATATSLAVVAADHDLPAVSMRAIGEALSGGLPVPDAPTELGASGSPSVRMFLSSPQPEGVENPELVQVAAGVRRASQAWKRAEVSPTEASQALEAIVLSPTRPQEVMLLPSPINLASTEAQSVGRELAYWAVKADLADKIAAEVAARRASGNDEVAGAVLLALIEVERKDAAALAERLQNVQKLGAEASPAVQAVAAHAAVAAFGVPELTETALPFVQEAVLKLAEEGRSGSSSQWSFGSSSDGLLTKLVSELQKQGQIEEANALVDRLLEIRRQMLLRQGDWGYAYYRSDLVSFADVQAQAGDVATTLKALARYLDSPMPGEARRYGVSGSPERAASLLRQQLAELDAGPRYEALRDWTMPDESRRTFRSMIYMGSGSSVPAEFLPEDATPIETQEGRIVSTFGLLVDAAKEAGRLDELSAATQPLVQEKLPDADLLDLLVRIAQEDKAKANERFKALADEARKRPDDAPSPPTPETERALERQMLEAYVAAVGLQAPGIAGTAEGFLQALLPEFDHRNVSQLQKFAIRELTRRRAERAGGDPEAPFEAPGLMYWHQENGAGAAAGPSGPVWVAHDGVVAHLAGRGHDRLFLKYPVVGDFRLSFESTTGWAKQAEIGYGGVRVEPQPWAKSVRIGDPMDRDLISRPGLPQTWDNGWDRMSVHVTPQAVRWYVNDILAFEDTTPSPTSPWLYLDSFDERRTHFRKLRLEGSPQIPREVALIDGSFIDGWSSAGWEPVFGRLAEAERKRTGTTSQRDPYGNPIRGAQKPVWQAADGELTAAANPAMSTEMPSLLSYFRPIQEGEALSYEFFWEPGVAEVHPAIGNAAMRLTEEGIRLRRYLHPQSTPDPLASLASEEIDVQEYRRGDGPLPLREGEWNRAEIRVNGGEASLFLNDVEVYARPIDPSSDRRFGFFRFAGRDEVRVRNVRLRGDWPAEFPAGALEEPLALSDEPSAAVRLARHAAIGERIYAWGAFSIHQEASALPPEERYEFLKAWVLPNQEHSTFRLATAFTPVNPPSLYWKEPAEPYGASRLHQGGKIVAPALDLVRVAAELGRLDRLSAEIDAAAASPGVKADPRSVEGLRTAIDVARGDVEAARARLTKALVTAESIPPSDVPSQRGAEVVAVLAALEQPTLLQDARTLAKRLVELCDAPGTPSEWRFDALRLWNVTRSTGDPAAGTREAAVPGGLARWDAVTFPTAATRGSGLPPASWRIASGEAEFLTGNSKDALYLDTPLQGDFELTCSLAMGTYREMRAVYAGAAIIPSRDGKELRIQPYGRGDRVVPIKPPVKIGDRIEMKIASKEGEMTVHIGGREVARERLPATVDPWLGFSSKESYCYGSVRDVRITGSPTIPKEIPLFVGPDLVGGRASYYEESIGGEQGDWTRKGDEVVAAKVENVEGRFQESVLQYHRPLIEDGEIEYEFFWKKGETEVHPALDRLTFVLRPDGVALHAMTDGKWDKTDAKPGDVREVEGAVAVPLKEGDWNRARLVVEGDVATLFVNDVEVASRRLAPTNQRNFGLFRWSDVSGVRVRNVVHRGDWPHALPTAEEQAFGGASTGE